MGAGPPHAAARPAGGLAHLMIQKPKLQGCPPSDALVPLLNMWRHRSTVPGSGHPPSQAPGSQPGTIKS